MGSKYLYFNPDKNAVKTRCLRQYLRDFLSVGLRDISPKEDVGFRASTQPTNLLDGDGAGFYHLLVGIKDIGEPAPTKFNAIAALEPFALRLSRFFNHQHICVYPHLRLGAFICGCKKKHITIRKTRLKFVVGWVSCLNPTTNLWKHRVSHHLSLSLHEEKVIDFNNKNVVKIG
jgi:hypothetical protein